MTFRRFMPFVLVGLFLSSSASGGPLPVISAQTEAQSAVQEAFQRYVDNWNKRNFEGVSEFLADDIVQMPPDHPAFIGKKALVADWKKFMEEYTDTWEPSISGIAISGNLAFLRGSFVEKRTPKAGGASQQQKGDGVWVLRRNEKGEWKLVLELWFGKGWE
jgi:ketosteroid isomerase-like protein